MVRESSQGTGNPAWQWLSQEDAHTGTAELPLEATLLDSHPAACTSSVPHGLWTPSSSPCSGCLQTWVEFLLHSAEQIPGGACFFESAGVSGTASVPGCLLWLCPGFRGGWEDKLSMLDNWDLRCGGSPLPRQV